MSASVTVLGQVAEKATLRDQFAMAALTGLLSNPALISDDPAKIAAAASAVADASMAERAKREGGR